MSFFYGLFRPVFVIAFLVVIAVSFAAAQSITGTVQDSTGAVVPGAKIEIRNPVSGLVRNTTSDNTGSYSIPNLPLNPYHLTVTATGFAAFVQDVEVRSSVPVVVNPKLKIEAAQQVVDVNGEAADLIE